MAGGEVEAVGDEEAVLLLKIEENRSSVGAPDRGELIGRIEGEAVEPAVSQVEGVEVVVPAPVGGEEKAEARGIDGRPAVGGGMVGQVSEPSFGYEVDLLVSRMVSGKENSAPLGEGEPVKWFPRSGGKEGRDEEEKGNDPGHRSPFERRNITPWAERRRNRWKSP
ncbi:MAG: hypothetical protein BWY86_00733 [Candidatus Aminicenantes bacterium ADurb.Bin508]|nr:MAG: hypothetical protein BWY86_00733 [Candidatus Aminicenantes bacterium ADurb.Bin508]